MKISNSNLSDFVTFLSVILSQYLENETEIIQI